MIVVASSSRVLRRPWLRWLEAGESTVEVAGREALERVLREHRPALLLLDFALPKLGRLDGLAVIHALSPSTRILLFSKAPKDREAVRALKAGAKGYTHYRLTPAAFREAVRAVRKGEVWASQSVISRLVEEFSSLSSSAPTGRRARLPQPLAELTERQREVACLVAEGASNKEISRQLAVTERTVKAHLTFIFRRLGVPDRLRLALVVSGASKKSP